MQTSNNAETVKQPKSAQTENRGTNEAQEKAHLKVANETKETKAAAKTADDSEASESKTDVKAGAKQEKNAEVVTSALEHLESAKGVFVEQVNDVVNRIMALTPKKGVFHNVGEFLSDRLLKTTTYLEENTSSKIGSDVFSFVKKNYVPLLGSVAGAGVAILVSRRFEAGEKSASAKGQSKKGNSGQLAKGAAKENEVTTH